MIDCYEYHRSLEHGQHFTVTDQHLTLLRRAYVGWSEVEFGAPEIDGKRPYGNSDVVADIARVLGEQFPEDDDAYERWEDDNRDRLTRLHVETAIALQIALQLGEFRPGNYARISFSQWTPVDRRNP